MYCCACGARTEGAPCDSCGAEPRLEGRYRLDEVLGRGAGATTWRATDEGPGGPRTVAIKESPLPPHESDKAAQLVRREAEVLRQLSHPQIPPFIESVVAGSGKARSLYLVQEHIEGTDLRAHSASHRYTEAEVLETMRSLCGVLSYLHTLSPPVVHRDLKPANVIRRTDGTLVLVDFGAVRDALRDAQLGGSTVAGTFGYMAPEQFAGDASPRSDLYGLGALAVALLTRKDPATLADHDRRVRWREHAQVSVPAGRLLDALLALDPRERPASAEDVASRVDRLLSGEPLAPASRESKALAVAGATTVASGALGWSGLLLYSSFGLAIVLVTSVVSLLAVLAFVLVFLVEWMPLTPFPSPSSPPRWSLNLPAGLQPESVDALFQHGQSEMRDRDHRGALQDFYRVLAADPGYPYVDKFAFAAGEFLVLDNLQQELINRAAAQTQREADRDRLLSDHREGSRVISLRAERDLKRKFADDPKVADQLGLGPPNAAIHAEKLAREGELSMAAGRFDEASRQLSDALDRSEDPETRADLLVELRKARTEVARESAETWRHAVVAEYEGNSALARRLFWQLRQDHPENPSSEQHLERLP